MKYYELTKEEEKILGEVENGLWKSSKDASGHKKSAVVAAKNTLNKTKNINIRLSEKVVQRLKTKAAREGVPYQTLVSSVLHRFANN